MRVGVFTPLLSQLPLEDVLKKLKTLQIDTVELGTGNYPGDPHCKLSMLDNNTELIEFKKKLDDHGFSHQRAELPREPAASECGARQTRCGSEPQDSLAGGETGRPRGDRFQRMPGRFAEFEMAQLGDVPVAAGLSRNPEMAVGRTWCRPIGRSTANSRPITA